MNLKHIVALTIPLAASASAYAVLAPNYQRLAELKAILNEPAVVSAFDVYHPIERVEFVQQDLYRVTAGSCHLDVAITNKPADSNGAPRVGPRQFVVKAGKRTCS